MNRLFKYHGAGNDFVLMDCRGTDKRYSETEINRICDRHFGIGADGFMLLEDDPESDFYMRYYNADGREGTMCGNGGRCIAMFAYHLGLVGKVMIFNSSDGLHEATVIEESAKGGRVRLKMIDVDGVSLIGDGFYLNTGSPHFVKLVEDVDGIDVFNEGKKLRYSGKFGPEGTNVNFIEMKRSGTIKVRTYERGVENETLACGTGAVASAISANIHTGGGNSWRVLVPGGELLVDFHTEGNGNCTEVYLTGPAEKVFEAIF